MQGHLYVIVGAGAGAATGRKAALNITSGAASVQKLV